MICKCKPKQNLPHIVKSEGGSCHFLSIPIRFDTRFNKFRITKYFSFFMFRKIDTNPLDCNGNKVPIRKYRIAECLTRNFYSIRFGKLI